MVNLLLPPPSPVDGAAIEIQRAWLEGVEALAKKSFSVPEARMWLCSALGMLDIPSQSRRSCILGLLGGDGDEGRRISERLVCMICENRPAWAAKVLARDDRLLRRFFSGNSKRILQWFGKFSIAGDDGHKWGARALARYTFVNRELVWHELKWNGIHGQAPATVAAKPHYFLELDIVTTINNFLDNVPSFWRSTELWDSMKDGDFVCLDKDFFVEEFLLKLITDNCPDTWRIVEDYLAEESFSTLSCSLLHLLSDDSLLKFINGLIKHVANPSTSTGKKRHRIREGWLEELILSGEKCRSLDDAILCNACVNHSRQMLMSIHDDEHEEEAKALKLLISEIRSDPKEVWAVRWDNISSGRWICMKWLAIEAWFLHARLWSEANTISFPALFQQNHIGYRQESKCMDIIQQPFTVVMKKRKKDKSRKHRKKKKHSHHTAAVTADDVVDDAVTVDDVNTADDEKVASRNDTSCWKLSTDNYSFGWSKVDLPAHLSGYAFGEYVKWAVTNW